MKLTKKIRMYFLAILIVALWPVLDTRTDRGGFLKALAFAASSWENTATVATTLGSVKGFEDSFKTWSWKAIPYARPPVGELALEGSTGPGLLVRDQGGNRILQHVPAIFYY